MKSIRAGLANISSAFARIEHGELFLYGADIQPYERASHEQHDTKRQRKLLMHRAEIDKLFGQTAVAGNTLVALRMYWKDARVKVEIGVAKGKEARDKRTDLKTRVTDREAQREVAKFNRRHG